MPPLDPPEELLEEDDDPPELEPPDEEEEEEEEEDDELSPQNVLRGRAQATSALAHAPSTQAAARYELPLEQSQQVGLQSA